MRSIWTGTLTILPLNIPVKLGSAVKKNELGLHMVRKTDGSRIRFTRVAEADDKEVGWDDIAKAHNAPEGLVVLDKKDFEKAYGAKNRVATVLMFTDASNIPPMAVKSSYWIQPDVGGDKTYALLAGALSKTGKVAVIQFAMRERVSVAVLRAYDGYLAIESLEWAADLLTPDFAAPVDTASDTEHELTLTLIERLSDKYDHAAQKDVSSEAVAAVIQDKIAKGQYIAPPARPESTGTAQQDLTAQLKAAVEAQKKPDVKEVPKPRAQRKTPVRKNVNA